MGAPFEGGQGPEGTVGPYVSGRVNKEGCKNLLNVFVYCNGVICGADIGA